MTKKKFLSKIHANRRKVLQEHKNNGEEEKIHEEIKCLIDSDFSVIHILIFFFP